MKCAECKDEMSSFGWKAVPRSGPGTAFCTASCMVLWLMQLCEITPEQLEASIALKEGVR